MADGIVPALEGNVERLCKAIPEIVAGAGLKGLAVVHHGLYGISGHGAGEFFLVGLAPFDDGHGKIVFTEVGVNPKHLLRFRLGFLCGFMHRVAFLPVELHRTQERARGFLPADDGAPLVVKLRQVAPGLDHLGVMVAEQRFGGRTDAHPLLQLFVPSHGYPGDLGGKALHVVFFFIQQAFRYKHWHRDVLVSKLLELCVKDMLNILPDGPAVRLNDHAAAHAGVIHQFRFFYNIGIPFGEILLHGSNRLYHFFLFRHSTVSSILSDYKG